MRFQILVVFISISLFSCSKAHFVRKVINNGKAPLGYLSDSRIMACADPSKVIRISVLNNPLDSMTRVSKINSVFAPLIFFYYHEVSLFIELGQKSLEQHYDGFFKDKLAEESRRMGCYTLGDSAANYTLDITFEASHTTSKLTTIDQDILLMFIYLHLFSSKGYPSNTVIKASATLKKSGSVVFEKKYELNSERPFPRPANVRIRNPIGRVRSNMAENLSLTTKECIENMVVDVNAFFSANP